MIFRQQKTYSADSQFFNDYLGELSGFLCQTKVLHWAAQRNSTHKYLDELHDAIGSFQDAIAEGYMGILGKMEPGDVKTYDCDAPDALSLINAIIKSTARFYAMIPSDIIFKGLTSETESFIQELNKYKYLFGMA